MSGVITTEVVRVPGLRAGMSHALPNLAEGTLAPFVAFYVGLWAAGTWGGLLAAIAWSYAALIRKVLRGDTTGGLLLLTAATLTARAAIALASGSIVVYFLQPVVAKVVVAAVLARSARSGRPLLLRLTRDLFDLPDHLVDRPAIAGWFRRASYCWAALLVAHAALGLGMLLLMPAELYVIAKTIANVAVKGGGIAASVWLFRRTASRAGVDIRIDEETSREAPTLLPQPAVA